MRVFIAGFHHETNTFAPTKADWAAFNRGDCFPALTTGPAIISTFLNRNFGIGGFINAAREHGWTPIPSIWAAASPSAHVTRDAFERIADIVMQDLSRELGQGGVEAVYLDLHGAAVAEHLEDPEGELISRIRACAGSQVPIIVSLDLHANVTRRMLEEADAMVAYRTYPHVDMAATGRRAAELLQRRLTRGAREAMHALRVPFLLPLNAQSTMMEPAASIYRELSEMDRRHDVVSSFAAGFPAADIAECGPVVWGYGDEATAAVQRLFARIDQPRSQWRLELLTPREAVVRALSRAESATQPVVIADTQDNPGAGGDSNTTGMLHALLAADAGLCFPRQIALGIIYDPEAAAMAHAVGVGAQLKLSLGKSVPLWSGQSSDPPVDGTFTVRALSDGRVTLQGPMMQGGVLTLGASACLEINGILLVVASGKSQMLDRELFRFVGIEPEQMKILVNKSSVHFRADFAPIACEILVAKAPGPMAADPSELPWTRLPSDMALCP